MRAFFFLTFLFALPLHAALKWESTHQKVDYKAGTATYRTAFKFKNTGKTAVRVTEIQSGCVCCTSARLNKRIYLPGEAGEIAMSMDLRGKTVPIAKPVIIHTDAAQPVALILEVRTPDGREVKIPRWNISTRR